LRQEAVLGLGGVALLEQLGHREPAVFHMNEGHSALLTLSLAGGEGGAGGQADRQRPRCVFTTHTPVPAGHDRFPRPLVAEVLGEDRARAVEALGGMEDGQLNMTLLGMGSADFVNAVSYRHAQVSRAMFPRFEVNWITNGVHAGTWVAPAIGRLLDEAVPGWRLDNALLRAAVEIELEKLRAAHAVTKRALFDEVALRSGVRLDPSALTIAVARRAAAYKRTDLLLSDPERLRALVERVGPVQIVYSGKAHPADGDGKALIERVVAIGRQLRDIVPVVYLEEYSMGLAGMLCGGVDLWLNTPVKPLEASGTSGMKAALNGVPSLSVLDGWWVEGNVEGVTGWAIGQPAQDRDDRAEAADLYAKLELQIAPMFYDRPDRYAEVMRSAIAISGSYFNAERMVAQYAQLAYRIGRGGSRTGPATTLAHAGR
jgi:starch phosphorylase